MVSCRFSLKPTLNLVEETAVSPLPTASLMAPPSVLIGTVLQCRGRYQNVETGSLYLLPLYQLVPPQYNQLRFTFAMTGEIIKSQELSRHW